MDNGHGKHWNRRLVGRVQCCVPGCSHTTGAISKDGHTIVEWVCAQHWRAVSMNTRRIYSRRKRRYKAFYTPLPGELDRPALERAQRLATEAWQRAKHEAMERAFGI